LFIGAGPEYMVHFGVNLVYFKEKKEKREKKGKKV
jgi:hypothetical protein